MSNDAIKRVDVKLNSPLSLYLQIDIYNNYIYIRTLLLMFLENLRIYLMNFRLLYLVGTIEIPENHFFALDRKIF